MEVTIQERIFSFSAEFDIATPKGDLHAKNAFFSFVDNIGLEWADGAEVARIEGSFSPLRAKHEFHLSDGRDFHFECEKLWTQVYGCKCGEDEYTLYQHRGLKYSIFHGDRQVAAFTKNRIVVGSGNRYEIRMDEDADLVVVLCMVLTISRAEDSGDNQTVKIDLGSIGPQEREYDEEWEPR